MFDGMRGRVGAALQARKPAGRQSPRAGRASGAASAGARSSADAGQASSPRVEAGNDASMGASSRASTGASIGTSIGTRTAAEVAGADAGAVRLAAVVVTHNRLRQLRRTVKRLLAEGVDHLVVIDNASTDGTRDWLGGLRDRRLHVVTSARNQGGAGGFEQGLRTARALHDADWYLLMDDDARPHPGAIARFRAMMGPDSAPADGDGNAGAAAGWDAFAGGVYYPDGAICETNRPARNPFWCWRSFLRTMMGGGRSGFHVADDAYATDRPVPVDAASFVGLFLSRGALDRADYPRGELFIYGDDVLYTLELTRAGGRIGFAPWLGFEHDCSTFRRGEGAVHRPLWKVYYNYRNGLFAYRAAAGPVMFWPVLMITVPKWLLKLRSYDPGERRVFLRLLGLALRDGLMGQRHRPHPQIRALGRCPRPAGARRIAPAPSER